MSLRRDCHSYVVEPGKVIEIFIEHREIVEGGFGSLVREPVSMDITFVGKFTLEEINTYVKYMSRDLGDLQLTVKQEAVCGSSIPTKINSSSSRSCGS